MNRRHIVAALIAAPVANPVLVRVGRIPPAESNAEAWASIRFGAGADAPVRTVSVRVSLWADDAAAETHRQRTIAGAGSDLLQGEFYQSDPVTYAVPADLSVLPADAMTWTTTVGVAAYRTEWVLLNVRRDTLVWDIWTSGAERDDAGRLAVDLALDLVNREDPAGANLIHLLPDTGQVPDGMVVEDRITSEGTPIAIP